MSGVFDNIPLWAREPQPKPPEVDATQQARDNLAALEAQAKAMFDAPQPKRRGWPKGKPRKPKDIA
jgi:hypothetical protein